MAFALILVAFTASLPPARTQMAPGDGPLRMCLPDNATIQACFQPALRALDPVVFTSLRDTIATTDAGNVTTFDIQTYSVEQFERSPSFLCLNRDKMITAIRCVENAVLALCPFMPGGQADRLAGALAYACSEVNNINVSCVRNSLVHFKRCHDIVTGQLEVAGDPTDPGAVNDGAQAEPDMTGGEECDWGGNPDSTKSDFQRGVMMLANLICFYDYKMLKCVRMATAPCHAHTADVMVTYMKKMLPPSCQSKIDQCGGVASTSASKCTADTCGATTAAMSCVTVLLAAVAVMQLLLY